MWPTEGLLKRLIRNNERETLQVVAASATAYSNSRKRLLKVLNRDKMERFPKMNLPLLEPNMRGAAAMEAAAAAFAVEAAAEDEEDVGDDFEEEDVAEGRRRSPRYPALPAGIKHFNWKVPVAGTHAAALAAALDKIQPESAMVFICPNAGETVKGVVEDLQQSGWSGAAALTQMLFPDSRNTGKGKSARRSGESRGWRSANRLQSLRDTTRLGFSGAADTYREAPILVSSEESVRGLHLDAVEAIFVLGMPKSAAAYLHMAGRTGRLPHPYGSAVLVAHGREIAKVTNGFSGQTGIREWTVLGRGSPPPSVLPVELRGGQQRLPDPGRRVERPEPWETGPWRRQQMLDEVGGGADPARSSDSGRTRSAAAERLDASLGAPVRRPR
ncbi:unnamed protein product [Polarella glacialis]|uniref:Helicase C-terminal domain-containing protein n=1 Tax=Polarella glacialis TaxID=89957 RepID=A0A813LP85_POLGL|nr:unnamed protein product [Polarella glacialis]